MFFIKPLYITTTLSHIPKISGSSDEIIIIDIPESTNSPINSCTADLDLTSIPFVGSSKIIISGFVATIGYNFIPFKAYVIVAALAGLFSAMMLTKRFKNNE